MILTAVVLLVLAGISIFYATRDPDGQHAQDRADIARINRVNRAAKSRWQSK